MFSILRVIATTFIMTGFLWAGDDPTDVRVATPFLASTSIEVAWSDNCDDETGYELQVRPEGQDWFTVAVSPANSTLLSLRGGSPGSTLSFRVRALRPEEDSGWTESPDVTLPSGFAIEAGRFIGGTVGTPLTSPLLTVYTLEGEGNASSFEVSDLPDGFVFDASIGTFSGSPLAPGIYRPMISATDGNTVATTFITLRVKPATAGPEELSPLPSFLFLSPSIAPIRYDLAPHFHDPDTSTAIRFQTNLGTIDSILYPEACPAHVENLLNYINRGDYDGAIFHRSAITATSGVAVVQAGLMKLDAEENFTRIVTDPSVVDEPALSNLTGTLAMAKTGAPDSGSSQVYFNTIDNLNLDGPQSNGGYTVFGRVTTESLPVIADISALPRGTYTASIDSLPQTLSDWPTTTVPEDSIPAPAELVQITEATQLENLLSYRLGPDGDSSLVSSSLTDTELTLAPVPGATGTTSITIEVQDLDGTVLPALIPYCVLDLDFHPLLSPAGHPAVTFRHEKTPAALSYEVQSSLDGQQW
ncbi:MAG: hypothetical protein CMN02_07315, partial [Roseibacillus sp.]|nr:hypothetical protein [Roseibacillus sp.]